MPKWTISTGEAAPRYPRGVFERQVATGCHRNLLPSARFWHYLVPIVYFGTLCATDRRTNVHNWPPHRAFRPPTGARGAGVSPVRRSIAPNFTQFDYNLWNMAVRLSLFGEGAQGAALGIGEGVAHLQRAAGVEVLEARSERCARPGIRRESCRSLKGITPLLRPRVQREREEPAGRRAGGPGATRE